MKFHTWKKEKRKDRVYIRMIKEDNSIRIILCDVHGKQINKGSILTIFPTGIHLHPNISSDFGLPLDERGRLKILNE